MSVSARLGLALVLLAPPSVAGAADEVRLAFVYTGGSLGAQAVARAPHDHELVVATAAGEGLPYKLKSHVCWRAPGIAVFAPSDELEPEGLAAVVAARAAAEPLGRVKAARSNDATLVQDPRRPDPDLVAMSLFSRRRAIDFPDLAPAEVELARTRDPEGHEVLIVTEGEAVWPDDPDEWTRGEVNRVDVGEARLFELAARFGDVASRATLVSQTARAAEARGTRAILVDLGSRRGDVGLPRADRAALDHRLLERMGYRLVVPDEFELSLGAAGLARASAENGLAFLAANLKTRGDDSPFQAARLLEVNGVKVGVFGLVDPGLKWRLPRGVLAEFTVEAAAPAAQRMVDTLRGQGAEAVVLLCNLTGPDIAEVSREVSGIDAVVADLDEREVAPEGHVLVELTGRRTRPGAPRLVAHGLGGGRGVGILELTFRYLEDGTFALQRLSHELHPVRDSVPADAAIAAEVREALRARPRTRGDVLFPAFTDVARRHPELERFDEATAAGRVSKAMWEGFLARLLRQRARAEVAVVLALPHFPPAVGKLRETDVRSWLWTEESIVVLDLPGADLKALLAADTRGDLVASGIDRTRWTVHGRPLQPGATYRVATTDFITEGARAPAFRNARRVSRRLRVGPGGALVPGGSAPLPLREFALEALRALRRARRGEAYLDAVAGLLAPDPAFEPLVSLTFDRPTAFVSFYRVTGNEGYGQVPESRVTAQDSVLVGLNGRYLATYDRARYAVDLGLTTAYQRQTAATTTGERLITEMGDDLKLDLTARQKLARGFEERPQPFLRVLFDTEFTPTVNPATGARNRRQLALRAVAGLHKETPRRWRALEIGAVIEDDLAAGSYEAGLQGRAEYTRELGRERPVGYRMRAEGTYFFPSGRDDATDLGVTFSMVHELTIPFKDELALSIAADVFAFRGKIPGMLRPGASALLRVGLTYDRRWKPRYQPFF